MSLGPRATRKFRARITPRLSRLAGSALAGAALCSLASIAQAQEEPTAVPSLDLRNFHPPANPDGGLYLEPTSTPGPMNFNVGSWLSYAHHPVSLSDANDDVVGRPVAGQLSLDFFTALGVNDQLALSLTLPSVLYQFESGDTTGAGGEPLPTFALGDPRFGAKATLIPTSSLGGLGLAVLAHVTAPTGDTRSYLGEGVTTGEFRVLGEYTLIAASLYGSLGAHLRASERTYIGETFGQSLPMAIGASLKPQALGWDDSGRWRWNVEVRSDLALSPKFARGATSPTAVGLSARYTRGEVSGIAGVEFPLGDAIGNPTVRGVLGISWSPRFNDMDNDGVEDEKDECPELAEDRDGFEDSDGCPDFDNDNDGVGDDDDKCPGEVEDEDEFEDDDGCIDADNDKDGFPDDLDECPWDAAPAGTGDGKGCPLFDEDGDGVEDDDDRCPEEKEDRDGFEDEDGCPDPDNDKDGVPDTDDACVDVKGESRADPELNGCPSPDKDGDTFDDATDNCPEQPEDFDGVEDEDGCPDDDSQKAAYQRAKPLLTTSEKGSEVALKWRVPPRFVGKGEEAKLDGKTAPSLRALAQLLNQNPRWIVAIGVRPLGVTPEAEQAALNKAFLMAAELRDLTHRDAVAETVSWKAVQGAPGAWANGFGMLVLTPKPAMPRVKLTNGKLAPKLKMTKTPPPRVPPKPRLDGKGNRVPGGKAAPPQSPRPEQTGK
ncbi:MAG: hypothetical protein R3B89_18895 [Polyangiaceae bacterium]